MRGNGAGGSSGDERDGMGWAGQTGRTAEEPPAAACSIGERWNEQGLAAAAADVTCMCATERFALQGDRRVEEGREGGSNLAAGGGGEAQPPAHLRQSRAGVEMGSELRLL